MAGSTISLGFSFTNKKILRLFINYVCTILSWVSTHLDTEAGKICADNSQIVDNWLPK